MDFEIRPAVPRDGEAVLALLPRLASFEIPPWREPEDLWQGDAKVVEDWLQGRRDDCHVLIAADGDRVMGASVLTTRPELLSGQPSAHIEVLAVAREAEGHGIGSALITATEALARNLGAASITLHVFGRNRRAREVYERLGYDPELIRHIKMLA